jgi:2-dehydropantoate 2-reductase
MAPFDHIVVLGAGAIGSVYAAKLTPRHNVTIVARPDHVAAIARNGLRLTGREELTCRPQAMPRVPPLGSATLVLLTTKVSDNRAAAAELLSRVRDDTVILCVQNGLGGEEAV